MTTPRKTKPAAETSEQPALRFEQALERLEAIVREMEDGDLELETMIARFEEGRKHLKFCAAKLNEVERRIETLLKKDDELTLEPFGETDVSGGETTSEAEEIPRKAPSQTAEEGELPF